MFDWLSDPQAWVALGTLAALEIVLGIDNIIFISILTGKLPPEQQGRARTLGLALAMGTRIALLFSINWVIGLTDPLFTLPFFDAAPQVPAPDPTAGGHGEILNPPGEISGRDLVLLLGGLFLVGKATHEIHGKLEGDGHIANERRGGASFVSVLVQIALLDIVFSLDSVITAVGMADDIGVMVTAVVIAVGVMLFAAGPISNFVHKHPTLKMLALAFLILIGVMLVAESFGQHVSKGYIYTAMAFSLVVELLNIRTTRKGPPVELHEPYAADGSGGTVEPTELRRAPADVP